MLDRFVQRVASVGSSEVCEDPDAGNHGGEDGGKGKGDPGFDWGGLVVLVVSGLLLLASG